MRELREKMDQAVQDTIAATRVIDAFKSPQSPQQSVWLKNYAGFPLECVFSLLCSFGLTLFYVTTPRLAIPLYAELLPSLPPPFPIMCSLSCALAVRLP